MSTFCFPNPGRAMILFEILSLKFHVFLHVQISATQEKFPRVISVKKTKLVIYEMFHTLNCGFEIK